MRPTERRVLWLAIVALATVAVPAVFMSGCGGAEEDQPTAASATEDVGAPKQQALTDCSVPGSNCPTEGQACDYRVTPGANEAYLWHLIAGNPYDGFCRKVPLNFTANLDSYVGADNTISMVRTGANVHLWLYPMKWFVDSRCDVGVNSGWVQVRTITGPGGVSWPDTQCGGVFLKNGISSISAW